MFRRSLGFVLLALPFATGCPGSTQDGADGTGDVRVVHDGAACQPGSGVLVGGERRLTPCQGECTFELHIIYPVMDASRCRTPQLTLSARSQPGGDTRVVTAKLAPAAWQRAIDIVLDLPDRGLVDARYEHGAPPEVLADADALVQSLIDQVRTCEGPDIVGCGY